MRHITLLSLLSVLAILNKTLFISSYFVTSTERGMESNFWELGKVFAVTAIKVVFPRVWRGRS